MKRLIPILLLFVFGMADAGAEEKICKASPKDCFFLDNPQTTGNRYVGIRFWPLSMIRKEWSESMSQQYLIWIDPGPFGASIVDDVPVGSGTVYSVFKGPLVYIDETALDQTRTSFIIHVPETIYDWVDHLDFDTALGVLFFRDRGYDQWFAYSFKNSFLWEFEEGDSKTAAEVAVKGELNQLTRSFSDAILGSGE
jgi:hypothetical protein